MPEPAAFDYAIVRVVPRVEREEFVNAGVILCCLTRRFLGARVELPRERLLALAPELDPGEVELQLAAIPLVCAGGEDAGPIGRLSLRERWHWLVSPSSTIVQPSPTHAGLCLDPQAELDHLFETMVQNH